MTTLVCSTPPFFAKTGVAIERLKLETSRGRESVEDEVRSYEC